MFGNGSFYRSFPLCLICVGCTPIPPANDLHINTLIEERIDKKVEWNTRAISDLQGLISGDLSLENSVQIALFNNPEVQASLENIGIAQAELIQAGLLSNPIVNGFVGFPLQQDAVTSMGVSTLQSILDLFLIPLRKKIAEAEYEKILLQVAHQILSLAFDVEETYLSLQAELKKLHLMQPIMEISQAARLLAEGQKQQGNINDLEYQMFVSEFLNAKLEMTKTSLEIIRLREKMNRLMGITCSGNDWSICIDVPEIPPNELSCVSLEEIALEQRLDLQAAAWEIERLARSFGIKQWWSYTAASVGVSYERDPEGFKNLGPGFLLEIPIFNFGQAENARLRALFRQSIANFRAKKIEILTQVHTAQNQLLLARTMIEDYQNEMIPVQKKTVSLSQTFYQAMGLSIYKLLEAKKQELRVEINYNIALRDYWLSKVHLKRALGGENCND